MLPPVLQAAGYQVVTAASAEDALALLKQGRRFDAIISDIEMPGMDGLQLAEALRADANTAGIPMIALSSHAKPGMLADVREAGFRDFVAKFDRPGLVAAIKDVTASWHEAA
jgi:two-component system chemotaxis sensor kinase CheA